MKPLRWGILSTAGIARKNWRAIRDSGNCIVTAVGSRDLSRGSEFIESCQSAVPFETPPAAFGSYEAFLASPNVDAVYIPLPTGLRKQWVLRAAAAGKHILCEKPCGLNAEDVREMIAACAQHRVQFMDGVMFMHNPRMNRIREILDEERHVGRVKRITSLFAFRAVEDFFRDNIRIHSELEPTGCLGDLGWYCIRFALWTLNWRLPETVSGRILSQRGSTLSPGPAPTDFSGELIFDDETSAGFFCSFLTEKQQWAEISGKKGSLRIPDFVHPQNEHEPAFELNGRDEPVRICNCPGDHDDSRDVAQDSAMFRHFAEQVRSGKLNEDWPMWALKTQQVTDACFASAQKHCDVPVQAPSIVPPVK
ncbi:MAG TPA: Gfo/Idh/MocA family oxidoreductase [Verrucomicrobiae bacterium]|nr:Gfo/Idh/MocA family oxidoreductase [Verrucomicrobiae bacterium]